jgi:hypothetical protein
LRYDRHPSCRTLPDVRVVRSRFLAVIPVLRLLGRLRGLRLDRCRLNVHGRRGLNDDGRRIGVGIVRVGIRGVAPPDGPTPGPGSPPETSAPVARPPSPAGTTPDRTGPSPARRLEVPPSRLCPRVRVAMGVAMGAPGLELAMPGGCRRLAWPVDPCDQNYRGEDGTHERLHLLALPPSGFDPEATLLLPSAEWRRRLTRRFMEVGSFPFPLRRGRGSTRLRPFLTLPGSSSTLCPT